MRRIGIITALFVAGTLLIVAGWMIRTVMPGVVWIGVMVLGVVLMVLSVLLPSGRSEPLWRHTRRTSRCVSPEPSSC